MFIFYIEFYIVIFFFFFFRKVGGLANTNCCLNSFLYYREGKRQVCIFFPVLFKLIYSLLPLKMLLSPADSRRLSVGCDLEIKMSTL